MHNFTSSTSYIQLNLLSIRQLNIGRNLPPVGLVSSPQEELRWGGNRGPAVAPCPAGPPTPAELPGGLASIVNSGSCECRNRVLRSRASAARTARMCCATEAAIRSCLDTRKRSKMLRFFLRCCGRDGCWPGGFEVRPPIFCAPPDVSPL